MNATIRDRLAIVVAVLAATAGILALSITPFDSGIRLTSVDGRVIVGDVDPHSFAFRDGIRSGMQVTQLNGVTLVRFPTLVYPDVPPTPDPEGNYVEPTPSGVEPPVPTLVSFSPVELAGLVAQPVSSLEAIEPAAIGQGSAVEGWPTLGFSLPVGDYQLQETTRALVTGLAVLLAIGWWLGSGRAGAGVRPLAVPLAVATSVPFLLVPLGVAWSPFLLSFGAILLAAAMVPLALALTERVVDPDERRVVVLVTGASAVAAVVVGIDLAFNVTMAGPDFLRWALFGAIPLVPGLAAAGPAESGSLRIGQTSSGRLLESAQYAVVGVTPSIALATTASILPLILWGLLLFAASRFTVRPLARLATRATLQRDLVVAATEAERARVAADIHDDALQELTLLVHRLDAAGDTEGADIARTVSDRLRAICGDLRLPILDDLGVGPALDWLVLRIERLAGGEVRLERSDGTRPPPDVELAFFRVAQEALSNAVKHGKPPIVVRYATSGNGASLSIDDAGPGIAPDAEATADRTGHFGLLNMQQRAEAIGAILDVRAWPSGGTHVKLDWRAP